MFLEESRFPLSFDIRIDLNHMDANHPSATQHVADVKTYLDEEASHNAVLGPFTELAYLDLHISPFMTRDKLVSKTSRVIIDLSYPPNYSVNTEIDKDQYLGTDFELTLPSLDSITDEIKN